MNSKKILLSVNPEHVEKILNGTKKYEYRTVAAKEDVNSIIIYVTTPIKKVVAEVEIIEVLELEPDALWKCTEEYSGITKDFYDNYFRDRKTAFAYKLGRVNIYSKPLELSSFGIKHAPQSFVYL